MNEISFRFLKAKVNHSVTLQRSSNEIPAHSPGSFGEMRRRFIGAITLPTEPKNARIAETVFHGRTQDLRSQRLALSCAESLKSAGHPRSSQAGFGENTRSFTLVTKPSTSGSTPKPGNGFLFWCAPTSGGNPKAIPNTTRLSTFPRGSRSKKGPNMSSSAAKSAIGRQTP